MRRFAPSFGSALVAPLAFVLACSLASAGCATYKNDLDRATKHYEANEFEAALALFRVLEPDMDSFSPGEKAQYAYFRGMTDYRLAGLANPGSGVADPKKSFRDNSRHWLAVAAAIEKQTPGGLMAEQKQRLNDALTDLNHDWYGGAEALPEGDKSAPAGGVEAPKPEGEAKPAAEPPKPEGEAKPAPEAPKPAQ